MSSFNNWLDTFVEEKGIDLEDHFEVQSKNGTPNIMSYGTILEHIKSTSKEEKNQIKDMLVKIDFKNGDVKDFLKYLAKAIALDL